MFTEENPYTYEAEVTHSDFFDALFGFIYLFTYELATIFARPLLFTFREHPPVIKPNGKHNKLLVSILAIEFLAISFSTVVGLFAASSAFLQLIELLWKN